MGRDLAEKFPVARHTFEEADEALGFSLSKLCFEGPEDQLKLTEFQQPAICTVSVALGAWLNPSFDATMAEHRMYLPLAAVLGLSSEETVQACKEAATETQNIVTAANFNSPEQTVISGAAPAVERAAELCKAKGAKRVVMLQVSAPFHCALMQPAQDRLAELLRALLFSTPRMSVAVNVDAALVREPDQLREALIRQVTGAVRWVDSMRALIARNPAFFVEVGPGKVLGGLMRQIDRGQSCVNCEDEVSLERVLQGATQRAAE